MLNVEAIFSDPTAAKGLRPTTIVAETVGGKPASPEGHTRDPASVDDLRAVERSDAAAGLLGDGPKVCGPLPIFAEGRSGGSRPPVPAPCPTCACPIFWVVPTGGIRCGNCCPRPEGVASVAIVVTTPDDRLTWEIEPADAWKRRREAVPLA